MKGLPTAFPIALLLALAVWPALGQQAPAPGASCVVYTIQDLSDAADTREYEQTITDAVSAAFSAQGFSVVPESTWKSAAPAAGLTEGAPRAVAPALEIARSVAAAMAVTGFYSVKNDEIYYSIQCWDVAAGRLMAGAEEATPFNLAFFSALNRTLTNTLLPNIRFETPPSPRLAFTSPDEGMEVSLSGDVEIGPIVDGRVTWPLGAIEPGARALVVKRKNGFHTSEETVSLTVGKDITLRPLSRLYSRGIEMDWTLGQLLGIGTALRGYPIPDWLFISAGGYLYIQPPAAAALRAVFHSDFSMVIGGYLFLPPEAVVRLGVSTGVGTIFSSLSTPGFPLYSDFYFDVVNWWIETSFLGPRLFLRQEFKYALDLGTNLLGLGWMRPRFPLTTLGVVFQW